MDIVQLLSRAIERLPEGPHSPGLKAVSRHISAAIRHFNRQEEGEVDRFTDAIYRSNQAYEGSLKEAYRVLAGRDPATETPHAIERYLEINQIIRPRVLIQLTRYRQDYRNPSTHDHKLDFDEDEAILAIVSVCAFAKLLVDQISEKIAFQIEQANTPTVKDQPVFEDASHAMIAIGRESLAYATKTSSELTYSEFEGGLAGRLASRGFDVKLDKHIEGYKGSTWDLFVSQREFRFGIEVRKIGRNGDEADDSPFYIIFDSCSAGGIDGGIVIFSSSAEGDYRLLRIQYNEVEMLAVTKLSQEELQKISKSLVVVES